MLLLVCVAQAVLTTAAASADAAGTAAGVLFQL
jgi:hypothetical protein